MIRSETLMIVGCGGVGVRVAFAVAPFFDVVLVDKDVVEPSNVSRQPFHSSAFNAPKAVALQAMLRKAFSLEPKRVQVACEWFTGETMPRLVMEHRPDAILACVDNHAARLVCLQAAERHGIPAFLAGNEALSAEAYVMHPLFSGTLADPRVYLRFSSDPASDPSAACYKKAAVSRQTASANARAAAHLVHLMYAWLPPGDGDPPLQEVPYRPAYISSTPYACTVKLVKDLEPAFLPLV